MKISEALLFLKNQLSLVSGESALFEAELILQHVLNCSRSELYIQHNNLISKALQLEFDKILERRKHHEPLPYILGKAYFHSKEFIVNKDVLIPRPDTEILVETILETEKKRNCLFLEIGIGSGAISAILLQERPDWQCIGTDISLSALRVAKQTCPDNVSLVCCDLFASIKPKKHFDFIVSNPPYISASEMAGLETSVRDFEPIIALDGGNDGLDFYRAFASQAGIFLKPGGALYCEIGYSQKDSVRTIFSSQGWEEIKIINDLAGRPRVAMSKPSLS
jgi:release factor glutamine methyltransferase